MMAAMSWENIAISIALLLSFTYFLNKAFFLYPERKVDQKSPPPGPPTLPIIGNLHLLGTLPHRTLQSLARTYGSIMSLTLGQVPVIVVSSPQASEFILKTHNTIFAGRPKTLAYHYFSYAFKGIAFAEYGPYWRHVRKLCVSQLLSPSKLELFAPLRREVLGLVVKSLEKASASAQVMDLSEVVHNLIEEMVFKMTFGGDTNKDHAYNYKELVQEGMTLAGAFNLADYLPWLQPFDLQVCNVSHIITTSWVFCYFFSP